MFLPHPLLRHRGHGKPSRPCVSAAAHSPQKNTPGQDRVFRFVALRARREAPMKLIIAGSRTFSDYQRLCQMLAQDKSRITQIITGGARGADQLGYRWAWKHTIG